MVGLPVLAGTAVLIVWLGIGRYFQKLWESRYHEPDAGPVRRALTNLCGLLAFFFIGSGALFALGVVAWNLIGGGTDFGPDCFGGARYC